MTIKHFFLSLLFLVGTVPTFAWMDKAIDEEFARYEKSGISKEMLETTWSVCQSDPSFQRYQVIDSKVYGPSGNIKTLLEKLVEMYAVPDIDFIYYNQDVLRDWFFYNRGLKDSAPVFAGAKDRSFDRVILFFDRTCDLTTFFSNELVQQLDNANRDKWPWQTKTEKLFWRGPAIDGCYCLHNWILFPRGRIVYFSKHRHPQLIDASLTSGGRYTDWRFDQAFKEAAMVSPVDQLQFKYLLLIDGVTCSFPDMQWRLYSGCLVMKHESDDVQWFSRELIPWKHYVPLDRYFSDVAEKIHWARDHDAEARQIAENAREFAETHLTPEQTLLYCYKTLVHYASLQKFKPKFALSISDSPQIAYTP